METANHTSWPENNARASAAQVAQTFRFKQSWRWYETFLFPIALRTYPKCDLTPAELFYELLLIRFSRLVGQVRIDDLAQLVAKFRRVTCGVTECPFPAKADVARPSQFSRF